MLSVPRIYSKLAATHDGAPLSYRPPDHSFQNPFPGGAVYVNSWDFTNLAVGDYFFEYHWESTTHDLTCATGSLIVSPMPTIPPTTTPPPEPTLTCTILKAYSEAGDEIIDDFSGVLVLIHPIRFEILCT